MLSTALIIFAGMLYYAALKMQDMSNSTDELTFALKGLPQNLYGIVSAVSTFGSSLSEHAHQVEGLVAIIRETNAERPKVEPFKEDGKDTNWIGEIPPSPFDTSDEQT